MIKKLKIILTNYLILFFMACSSKPPISVEEARKMETEIIYAIPKDVLKASINVLQDMYYSIEEVDNEMGILVATKETQSQQGEIRKEQNINSDESLFQKIVVGFFLFTIITGFFILVEKISNSDINDNENHHYHPEKSIDRKEQYNGTEFYRYRVTINVSSLNIEDTNLRVSVVGQKIIGGEVSNVGPIQDRSFFNNFFNKLNNELGY
ncbi:MAG: hypothetical protein CMF96_12665 [Candidatus Marinimicrobia bacterium]|nr:hypothetical protein [Candidatus Neomarinimicrobiota bacterium]